MDDKKLQYESLMLDLKHFAFWEPRDIRRVRHREAERAVLATLGAGCTLPVAALAHTRLDEVSCLASLFDAEGTQAVTVQRSGSAESPEDVGRSVAEALLARGGAELLQEIVS